MRKRRLSPVAGNVVSTVNPKPPEAWRPLPGAWCSFYYEGGHGEKYWSGGWHHGVIREIPIKGRHKNWIRVELMTDHYAAEDDPKTGLRVRRMAAHEKPWVFGANVNELGDTAYHGLTLLEAVAERKEEKKCEILSQLSPKDDKKSTSLRPKNTKKSEPFTTKPKPVASSAKANIKGSKKTQSGSRVSKPLALTTGPATTTPVKSRGTAKTTKSDGRQSQSRRKRTTQ
jgi:hypothetical protein